MTRSRMLLSLTAGVALFAAAGVRAETKDDVEALRADVKRLEAEVKALQGARPAAAKEEAKPEQSDRLDLVEVKQGDAVVKGDIPGSFRIPGTEISMRLYGYAELNWVHLFGGDTSGCDYATCPGGIPTEGSDGARRHGRDYFTIRESRLGLETGMPTKYGVLQVKLEGDFNNEPRTGNSAVYDSDANVFSQLATNSYGFRVRHAYGQFAGLLIGQTWSTFMDADNFPETVDYNGPVGGTFIRQPQIRYSRATQKAGTFTAALENSVSYVTNAPGLSASRLPDLVLRYDKSFERVSFSVRAVGQQIRLKGDGVDAEKFGLGVAASALVKTRGRDFLTVGITEGTGIGRYLNYIEGAYYDAAKDEILLEAATGAYVGYQLKVSDLLRFNFAYGMTYSFTNDFTRAVKADPDINGGLNRWVQQGHAGFFVSPVPATDFGLEAIYGARKTLAGDRGDDFRLNFLARYYIN